MLAPGESSQALSIARAGTVAIGCNIHDHMIAYLYVSDAPYAARTENGRATLTLPAGDWTVRAWHPQLRHDPAPQTVKLGAADTRALSFAMKLLPDPRRAPDSERSGY